MPKSFYGSLDLRGFQQGRTVDGVSHITRPSVDNDPAMTAAVLDTRYLDELAAVLDDARLAGLLNRFLSGLSEKRSRLDQMDESEILDHVHASVSMAGHFGFLQLSHVCSTIEEKIRAGHGAGDLAELQTAIDRAFEAVRASSYGQAVERSF